MTRCGRVFTPSHQRHIADIVSVYGVEAEGRHKRMARMKAHGRLGNILNGTATAQRPLSYVVAQPIGRGASRGMV